MPTFGKIITEEGWSHGNMVSTVRREIESVPVTNRQQLLEKIFSQLEQLSDYDSVTFTVFADKHTHQPYRIEVQSEVKL